MRWNLLILALIAPYCILAQQYKWVHYHKKSTPLHLAPSFFDQSAINNRKAQGIAWESSDLPLDEDVCDFVESQGELIVHSRWLNASLIYTHVPAEILTQHKKVKHVSEYIPEMATAIAGYVQTEIPVTTQLAKYQTNSLQGDTLQKLGFTGKGIKIAVFDVGFNGIQEHIAFQHIYARNGILKSKDFIRNKENKTEGGSHGTAVLSCIAGYYGKNRTGLATDAEFLLARTEHNNREPAAEEAYWLAAAEWADLNGAKIISSSLGYTYHRYRPKNMDGKTSVVAKAASMASRKGILVVNAMGNDGDNGWHYINTPADVDSVLSVGGIDPNTNTHISFSSYGPNNAGVLKPNVSAAAYTVCATPNGNYSHMYGTSFATPLISGLAACVWQQHPEWTNMEVKNFLEQKGHLNPYFDYAVGYGVPQMFALTKGEKARYRVKGTELTVSISELFSGQGYQSNLHHNNAIYIAVKDKNQKLIAYYTYELSDPVTSIEIPEMVSGNVLTLSFKGNYETIEIR